MQVDRHRAVLRGIFVCVVYQVCHDLADAFCIAVNARQVNRDIDIEDHRPLILVGALLDHLDHLFNHFIHIDRLEVKRHLAGLDPGDIQ